MKQNPIDLSFQPSQNSSNENEIDLTCYEQMSFTDPLDHQNHQQNLFEDPYRTPSPELRPLKRRNTELAFGDPLVLPVHPTNSSSQPRESSANMNQGSNDDPQAIPSQSTSPRIIQKYTDKNQNKNNIDHS